MRKPPFQILALLALLLAPVSVQAQPVPATPTSQLAFDHDGVDTSGYELQVDGGAWAPVGVTVQQTGVRVMNLPALTPGPHTLAVRACGPGGCSGPSNTLDVQLVVVPSVPTQLRLVNLADASPPDSSNVRR